MTQAETGCNAATSPGQRGCWQLQEREEARTRFASEPAEEPALQPLIPEFWPPGCERVKSAVSSPQYVVTCCSCPR